MFFDYRLASDVPVCMVDVYLETPAEQELSDADIWAWLLPQLAGVCHPGDVEAPDLHIKNAAGQWIDVYRNDEGRLVVPSWSK